MPEPTYTGHIREVSFELSERIHSAGVEVAEWWRRRYELWRRIGPKHGFVQFTRDGSAEVGFLFEDEWVLNQGLAGSWSAADIGCDI